MSTTARALADEVRDSRLNAWEQTDHATAIVATSQLGPEDTQVVRRVVASAGYSGEELEQMVEQVSGLVVGTVEALADDIPTAASA